jgi:hypothetical protein
MVWWARFALPTLRIYSSIRDLAARQRLCQSVTLRQQAGEPFALDLAGPGRELQTSRTDVNGQAVAGLGLAQAQGLQLPPIEIGAEPL